MTLKERLLEALTTLGVQCAGTFDDKLRWSKTDLVTDLIPLLEQQGVGASMLFKLSSDEIPTIYEKADDREEALEMFRVGFSTPEELKQYVTTEGKGSRSADSYIEHPSFKCEVITPEQFVESLPDEFQINDDVSF